MSRDTLSVALLTEVFHDESGPDRLVERLVAARRQGAEVAVLPELSLNAWCPSSRVPSDADAEEPGGPRQSAQAAAARAAGITLLGGAIVRDPVAGSRRNAALLFDPSGDVMARYDKVHLPQEEGFWEADHYEPGDALAAPVDVHGFPIAVQICSDSNRPEVTHILGALGAFAILAPRATPPETYPRWRLVLRANAVTSGLYVVSVNRPGPEPGANLGGPSLVIAPDGEVVCETTQPLAIVTLDRATVEAERSRYPGYLPVRARLYAQGWNLVAGGRPESPRSN